MEETTNPIYFEVLLKNGETKRVKIGHTSNVDTKSEFGILAIEMWLWDQLGVLLKDKRYAKDKIDDIRNVTKAKWITEDDEQILVSGIKQNN